MSEDLSETGLIDHLVDLRRCIVKSLLAIAVGFALSIYYAEVIFEIIRAPILPYLGMDGLVFTAPMDKFVSYLKVSFLAGTILTCPYWLYQIWQFVAPGLYRNEKKYAMAFIFAGTVLFLTGVFFVYNIVFPMAFKYLMTFGSEVDKPMITISDYLSFFNLITMVFGLAFEMPLVLVILGMMGVIDHEFLRAQRRMAIVVMAVLSALVTPPDVISMLALLAPLMLLYEASIWAVFLIQKKQQAID